MQAAAERTMQELERVRDNPLALRDFLKRMPKGYTVNEIEVDDGAYEVELIDKRNGTRIEAHVHPATGELLLGYDD